MQYIFSQDKKFSTWRRLWVALARAEMELGLPKKLQERCLGPRGPFGTQQCQGGNAMLNFFQIHKQLVHPQRGPLTHGDQLGRLKVGKSKGR